MVHNLSYWNLNRINSFFPPSGLWFIGCLFVSSYFLRLARLQVQLHGLLNRVRFFMLVKARLLGRIFSLLFSRCKDLRAVTPSKAALENWLERNSGQCLIHQKICDGAMWFHYYKAFCIFMSTEFYPSFFTFDVNDVLSIGSVLMKLLTDRPHFLHKWWKWIFY